MKIFIPALCLSALSVMPGHAALVTGTSLGVQLGSLRGTVNTGFFTGNCLNTATISEYLSPLVSTAGFRIGSTPLSPTDVIGSSTPMLDLVPQLFWLSTFHYGFGPDPLNPCVPIGQGIQSIPPAIFPVSITLADGIHYGYVSLYGTPTISIGSGTLFPVMLESRAGISATVIPEPSAVVLTAVVIAVCPSRRQRRRQM